MVIIRIERNGEGPYKIGNANLWGYRSRERHTTLRHTPSPDWEANPIRLAWNNADYDDRQLFHFGFKNAKQLNAWFDSKDMRKLVKHHFDIVAVEVEEEHYYLGNKQVMYNVKHSRQLIKRQLADFTNTSQIKKKLLSILE